MIESYFDIFKAAEAILLGAEAAGQALKKWTQQQQEMAAPQIQEGEQQCLHATEAARSWGAVEETRSAK